MGTAREVIARTVVVRKRWLYALIGSLAVEFVLALLIRLDQVGRFLAGPRTLAPTLAVIGLAWLLVVVLIAYRVMASLVTADRTIGLRDQALTAAAATSSDWLWETDGAHRFTYCSAGVRVLLGYEPEELVGRTVLSLLPPEQLARTEAIQRQAVAAAAGWDDLEMTWCSRDGAPVVLRGSGAPIIDHHRRVVGFRGTRRRLTQADVAERQLAAASHRISAVLATGGIDIALQPIVNLSTGRLVGLEALARFRDGRAADLWFGEARQTGQCMELDGVAFRAALALLPRLPAGCYLSINATPELLLSGDVTRELLAAAGSLERLVVEITEHARIADYDEVHSAVAPLRERGVRIAVDDTGAGYASLAHVLQLRPDIVKVDRSLIKDITNDPARRSLITALVLLALNLDASITGEGVQTASELATLATLGVDTGQGYFLARPSTDRRCLQRWGQREWVIPGAGSTRSARKSTRRTRSTVS